MKHQGHFSTETDIYEYDLIPSLQDESQFLIGYSKSGLPVMYVVDGLHSAADVKNSNYIKKKIFEQEKKNGQRQLG